MDFPSKIKKFNDALDQLRIDAERHICKGCRELSLRFPKRRIHLLSGNGSTNLVIEGSILGHKVLWDFPIDSVVFAFGEGWHNHQKRGLFHRRLYIEEPVEFEEVRKAEDDTGIDYLFATHQYTFRNGNQHKN